MFFRATLFSTFGASKRWLSTNADGTIRTLTDADYYKAGFITGAAAAFFEAPIDFYKSQIQVQIIRSKADPNYKRELETIHVYSFVFCFILNRRIFRILLLITFLLSMYHCSAAPYTTVSHCVRATLSTSGWRGPFQGLGPTILRNAPANAVYLGSFEVLKRRAADLGGCQVKDLSALAVMGSGATAGVLYWLAIYPVDVVKSAMMTDSIIPSERSYPNMMETAKKLWAEGGVPRFFRGFSPCLMRAVPANAVMLFTVDKVQQMLH